MNRKIKSLGALQAFRNTMFHSLLEGGDGVHCSCVCASVFNV